MLTGEVRPSTVEGVKRLATRLRKERGVTHINALDIAAQAANCSNFRHAQRSLPNSGRTVKQHCLLLTVYWVDDTNYENGRETLKISVSKSPLNICTKANLKKLRGFGTMRMVADDHFVSDELAQSQERARDRICSAVRSLRFVEHTGLLPSRDHHKAYAGGSAKTQLPDKDHSTNWVDPATGQFFVVDEPYSRVPDQAKRAEWAARYGWKLRKTSCPGMYNPYNCDLYVATDGRQNYDLDALITKIDGLPTPLIVKEWPGESAPSLDVFVSPAAKTPQDRRRARSRGTIFPEPNAKTIPYRMAFGNAKRRPSAAPGVKAHIDLGQMIKAVLRSSKIPQSVYKRMDSLRSTLEDWMALEIGRGELEGPEFFDVYYRENDRETPYGKNVYAQLPLTRILQDLKYKLLRLYPDCRPLRQQLHLIDMSASLIHKISAKTE